LVRARARARVGVRVRARARVGVRVGVRVRFGVGVGVRVRVKVDLRGGGELLCVEMKREVEGPRLEHSPRARACVPG